MFDNGTSAATPVAAGVGALILSARPQTTPAELKDVLLATAIQVGNSRSWDADHGHGVIHALSALKTLM